MNTLQQTYSASYSKSTTHIPAWKKFINWTKQQEKNRLLWLAIAVAGHGCFFTIVTIAAILLSGNSFFLWPFAIAAMVMTLVTNLAALPTKITIPVFFLSLVIDVILIAICISNGFDINSTFV